MEGNEINEDQIEPIIQDFAAYCLRHSISYDTVIKSGREALYLEEKFGIPVERIPEYIIQEKERIDRLEDERQEILRKKQQDQEERHTIRQQRDTIVVELEKYRKEIPLIKQTKELETKLDEANKLNEQYERYIIELKKELNDAGLAAMRSEGDRIEIDARCKNYARWLSLCLDEQDKLKEVNEKLASENKELKLNTSDIKTVEKQLAENDGQTA